MPPFRPTIETLRAMLPFLASTAAMLSGYDVMKLSGMQKAVSYSIVHRLTRAGWLNSRVERSNLRMGYKPRVLYTPTPEGIEQAKAVLGLLRSST